MTTATKDKKINPADIPYEGEVKEVEASLLYAKVAQYRQAAKNLAAAKAEALEIEEELKAMCGGYEHLACNGERLVHWPWKKLTKFDKRGLAKKYPDVVAEFTTEIENGSRSFSVPGTAGVE